MVVTQSTSYRNQRIALKAFAITLMAATTIEIIGILQNDYYRIVAIEYAVVLLACFILSYTYVLLTTNQHIEIIVDERRITLSLDGEADTFTWYELRKVKQPNLFSPCWLFELSSGKVVKLKTKHFNKQQKHFLRSQFHSVNLKK